MTEEQDSLKGEPTRLDGLTALVTGAGRGLGRGCTLALALAGARVVALSRTESELDDVISEVRRRGGDGETLICDVTDSRQIAERIGSLERIDILINNAGGNVPQPFLEVEEETLDHLLSLNVKATFLVAQAAARLMAEGGGGCIINMSSQMGHVGAANRTVYCTTKHAVEGLTKALAVELGPSNIRVNAVAPTFIETPMTLPFFEDPSVRSWALGNIPLGRLGTIDEVAGAVVFLASPAASLITGTSLLVDGGWTAH